MTSCVAMGHARTWMEGSEVRRDSGMEGKERKAEQGDGDGDGGEATRLRMTRSDGADAAIPRLPNQEVTKSQ